MKYLIEAKKGASYRLRNLETNDIRILERDLENVDFIIGSIIETDKDIYENDNVNVISEILGDSSKKRIEVEVAKFKIGDLIDNVPILIFGKKYAKNGKKVAFAYFS